jgi:RNA polymerase sigma-70 factor (ECF subfamily)
VEALRPEDRDIVAARYFLELNEAETAALLGVPRGTAKSRLSRALARLRATLDATAERRVDG